MKLTFVRTGIFFINKKYGLFLCANSLYTLFDIPKNIETIDIVIKTKPDKNSYKVELWRRACGFNIELSNSLIYRQPAGFVMNKFYNSLPDVIYVSLYA